jgi:hypothetical protein
MQEMALYHVVDFSVVVIAMLSNLLLAGMFYLRGKGSPQTGNKLGWMCVVLGIPLLAAAILNGLSGRPWWTVLLPAIMIAFDIVEFLLDCVMKSTFRHTRLVGPYLGLFYLALFGMIGYSFAVGKGFGFITLTTYFLCLAATAFAGSRQRLHGT